MIVVEVDESEPILRGTQLAKSWVLLF